MGSDVRLVSGGGGAVGPGSTAWEWSTLQARHRQGLADGDGMTQARQLWGAGGVVGFLAKMPSWI